MIIFVTDKIRKGELVLPTIGWPAKSGTKLTLTEDQFYKSDIQAAISQGFLRTDVGTVIKTTSKTKIISIHDKPISLDKWSLKTGDFAYLTEDEMMSINVQNALSSGLIGEVTDEKVEVKAKGKTKKKASVKKVVSKKEIKQPQKEPTTKPASWNPHSNELMDKDKSFKTIGAKLDGVDPANSSKEVQVGEVDFEKEEIGKLVVSTKKKRGRPAKNSKETKKASKKSSNNNKKSIKAVGRRRVEPKDDGMGIDIGSLPNEVGFVDQEQLSERIAYRNRLADQNSEVE